VPSSLNNTLASINNEIPDSTPMHERVTEISEIEDLTHFVQNNQERKFQFIEPTQNTGEIQSLTPDIIKFLSRPLEVASDVWLSTVNANAAVTTNAGAFSWIPYTVLTTNNIFTNKISGFRFFRANCHVRVVLNAQPFHAGRLLLHFVPSAPRLGASILAAKNFSLGAKTCHPCVEIDCRDGSGEMVVPYCASTNYMDYQDTAATDKYGTFYLDVLSPLTGPAPTNIGYTVYMWFTEVELEGPITPQSGRLTKKESQIARTGPVTEISSKVKQAADFVSEHVPLIAPAAGLVSWAANIVNGVAGIFGWSKPLNPNPPTPYYRRDMAMGPNCDGVNNALALSYISKPELMAINVGPSKVDEMSFDFLKKYRSFTSSINWSTGQASGVSLFSGNLTYNNIREVVTTTNGSTRYYRPPMLYFSNYFQYARGGIILHLKFIKTQFHSGRLAITWQPSSNCIAATNQTGAYCLREVVDISDSNEVILELPYISAFDHIGISDVLGKLDIVIVNELVAPSTVASSINMLTFYGVADDFQLAAPRTAPLNGIVPQSGETVITAKVIGGAKRQAYSTEPGERSVGEYITSVKQICNRLSQIYTSVTIPGQSYNVYPWFSGLVRDKTSAGYDSPIATDLLSEIMYGYTFVRGSMRIAFDTYGSTNIQAGMLHSNGLSSDCVMASPSNYYYLPTLNSVAIGPTSPYSYANVPCATFSETSTGHCFADVLVPYYNKVPKNIITTVCASGGASYPNAFDPVALATVSSNSSITNINFYRAAGDDFQLGYFVGFPYQTS